MVERLAVTFELIEEKLYYISFNTKVNQFIPYRTLVMKNIIVGLIKNRNNEIIDVSFGSKTLIFDEGLFPNRYSPIMESFFKLEV